MVIHTFSFLKKVYIFLKFWLVSTFSFSWKHFFTRYNNSLKIESYKLIYFYILSIAALSGASHLCWRAFRLWKMFTRICQWILASLDGLFWKSIVSKIFTAGYTSVKDILPPIRLLHLYSFIHMYLLYSSSCSNTDPGDLINYGNRLRDPRGHSSNVDTLLTFFYW